MGQYYDVVKSWELIRNILDYSENDSREHAKAKNEKLARVIEYSLPEYKFFSLADGLELRFYTNICSHLAGIMCGEFLELGLEPELSQTTVARYPVFGERVLATVKYLNRFGTEATWQYDESPIDVQSEITSISFKPLSFMADFSVSDFMRWLDTSLVVELVLNKELNIEHSSVFDEIQGFYSPAAVEEAIKSSLYVISPYSGKIEKYKGSFLRIHEKKRYQGECPHYIEKACVAKTKDEAKLYLTSTEKAGVYPMLFESRAQRYADIVQVVAPLIDIE